MAFVTHDATKTAFSIFPGSTVSKVAPPLHVLYSHSDRMAVRDSTLSFNDIQIQQEKLCISQEFPGLALIGPIVSF